MLNNRQISPNRNCLTLAIPWCFYKISRAFHGISTSIICIDPFKSIFSFGKKSQSIQSIFCELLRCIAIYCDLLRFNAIFFSAIKLDGVKRLKRTVKFYFLHGFPVRYSRKFKIDRVESYRMTHHYHRESRGEVFFFHLRGRGSEGVFFICMLYVSVYIFKHN